MLDLILNCSTAFQGPGLPENFYSETVILEINNQTKELSDEVRLELVCQIFTSMKNEVFKKSQPKFLKQYNITALQLKNTCDLLKKLDIKLDKTQHYLFLKETLSNINTYTQNKTFKRTTKYKKIIIIEFNLSLTKENKKIHRVKSRTFFSFVYEFFDDLKKELNLNEKAIIFFEKFFKKYSGGNNLKIDQVLLEAKKLIEKLSEQEQLGLVNRIYFSKKHDSFHFERKKKIAHDYKISFDELNTIDQYLMLLDLKLNKTDHYFYIREIFKKLNERTKQIGKNKFNSHIIYTFNLMLLNDDNTIQHVTKKTLVNFISEHFKDLKKELNLNIEIINRFKELKNSAKKIKSPPFFIHLDRKEEKDLSTETVSENELAGPILSQDSSFLEPDRLDNYLDSILDLPNVQGHYQQTDVFNFLEAHERPNLSSPEAKRARR